MKKADKMSWELLKELKRATVSIIDCQFSVIDYWIKIQCTQHDVTSRHVTARTDRERCEWVHRWKSVLRRMLLEYMNGHQLYQRCDIFNWLETRHACMYVCSLCNSNLHLFTIPIWFTTWAKKEQLWEGIHVQLIVLSWTVLIRFFHPSMMTNCWI